MINRVRYWFAPPVFEDEEKTRLAALLNTILLAYIVAGFVIAGSMLLIAPESIARSLTVVVATLLAIGEWLLMRRGYVRLTSWLLVSGLWVMSTVLVIVSGGLRGSPFGYFYAIILGPFLLGSRVGLGFGLLSIMTGLGLALLEANTNLFPPAAELTPAEFWVIQSTVIVIVLLLIVLANRSIIRALERARGQERALAERNRDLEREMAEREQAEEALRHVEERFAKAFHANLSGIAITTIDEGRYVDVNDRLLEVLGYSREEVIGRTVVELGIYESPANRADLMRVLREQGAIREVEMEGRAKSGELRHVLMSMELIELAGEPHILTMLQDITERKQAEEARLELALERERADVLAEFIGNVTHDLKTPLSGIKTNLYLLGRLTDPEKRREQLEAIEGQTTHLEKIIQDILASSRLDHLPGLNLGPTDLNAMFRVIETNFYSATEERALTINFDLESDLPAVLADQDELYRALVNLVENAVNYTPAEGTVTIRTQAQDGNAIAEVSDTGIGISAEELPHIFDRFFRSANAKSIYTGGTGLGLAMVKKIIDMHNGHIEVTSVPGEGTTFRIQLPAAH